MIKSFKNKLLKSLLNGDIKATTKEDKKIRTRLNAINSASQLDDIRLPGYDLHELKGERKNTWAIKITGNWRITFRFEDGHAYEVDYEDYHKK